MTKKTEYCLAVEILYHKPHTTKLQVSQNFSHWSRQFPDIYGLKEDVVNMSLLPKVSQYFSLKL